MTADAPLIDSDLVRSLLREQFPAWSGLDVRPVDVDGWDNRSFRVGGGLVARLPSAAGYEPQVRKEARWLPVLGDALTFPIPHVLAVGRPGSGYPFEWSVRGWLDGTPASSVAYLDQELLAEDLAGFLLELRALVPDGPAPGEHSASRGAPLVVWDEQVRAAVAGLGARVDGGAALAEWESALAAEYHGGPVWFHGDLAPGNVLLRDGRVCAIIDFGCCGVGDPSCDLAIAWTSFDQPARERFRAALAVDDREWQRGRGWALWKALITVDDPAWSAQADRTLRALGVAVHPGVP